MRGISLPAAQLSVIAIRDILRGVCGQSNEFGKSRAALPPLEETGNTAADATALELEDQDDDDDSSIVGHPEEV